MSAYSDRYWWSRDTLRLHFRDYGGGADGRPPVLCLHGLTRNARDFEALAPWLAAQGWRVISPVMRGRAESAYARDAMTYVPLVYLQDLAALIEAEGLQRVVAIGTSLGGLLTMLLAGTRPGFVAGAVLNDIGPEIDASGLDRIRGYVGRGGSWPSWLHAARAMMADGADVYPGWGIEDWLIHAKRLCRVGDGGRIVFDYDPRIAEPFRLPGGETAGDLWPAFGALQGTPVLSLRGGLSDILSPGTQARMAEVAGVSAVTVPGVGHAPTLDEPEARAAIGALLATVLAAEMVA